MQATDAERHDQTLPPEDVHHPGPRQYVVVAIVLAVITALEVGLFYVDVLPFEVPNAVVTALLMVMMVLKFGIVAAWFMHLRFDSRIFRRLFVAGIILAIGMSISSVTLYLYTS